MNVVGAGHCPALPADIKINSHPDSATPDFGLKISLDILVEIVKEPEAFKV
jgi:hypothetical protein